MYKKRKERERERKIPAVSTASDHCRMEQYFHRL
jgi:hypothetical protein